MLTPPKFLFIHLSEECNQKCAHCLYWKKSPDPKISNILLDRKLELLNEFANLNPRGVVVTCGAENTIHLNEFFRFTRECRRLRLHCLSATNGTKISSPAMAERFVAEGPTEISISLDSHLEDLHDEMRGIKGSFKSATGAIQLLLDARRKLNLSKQRIHAMLLLFDSNYLELETTYDFVLNQLGADKLKINLLQPTFGCPSGHDDFFTRHSTMDASRLKAILLRCDLRFKLNLNPDWISQIYMYTKTLAESPPDERGWSRPIQTPEQICNSPDRNIVIDMSGIARLCVSEGFPGTPLLQPGDMRHFWESSDLLRERMRTCTQLCGISHSMRRTSATFDGLTHFN